MKKDSWDAALYDAKHSFVSKFGEHLLDLLEPKKVNVFLTSAAVREI